MHTQHALMLAHRVLDFVAKDPTKLPGNTCHALTHKPHAFNILDTNYV